MQARGIDGQEPRIDGGGRPAESAREGPPGPLRAEAPRFGGPGARFGTLLRPRTGAGGAAAGQAGAAAAEARPPTFTVPAREISVRAVAPRPEIARLLLAPAHAPPEARIELRGGLFAGASIHLVTAPGGIEVRLGAPTEAARLALASVIDRARHQLGSRGIVMRPGASLDSGSRQNEREGRRQR